MLTLYENIIPSLLSIKMLTERDKGRERMYECL